MEIGNVDILLIVLLVADLWLKLPMEIVDSIDSIFTCLPSLHIFVWILRTVMYQSVEAHAEPREPCKINLLARILNAVK